MLEEGQASIPARETFEAGTELLRFVEALSQTTTLSEFSRRFSRAFNPLFGVPMHGVHVDDPWTGRQEVIAIANVSDAFLARYERYGREIDLLRENSLATRRPTYNIDMMSMEPWLEHPLYQQVKQLHDIRHEIQAPVLTRDGIVGTVNFGTSDPDRGFTPYEVRFAEAVARAVGSVIERIHQVDQLSRELDRLQTALEIAGAALAATVGVQALRPHTPQDGPLARSQRVSSRRLRDASGWEPRLRAGIEAWGKLAA